ncbi:hypothetical protein JCM8208_000843 [Rhodotorula glutinis]
MASAAATVRAKPAPPAPIERVVEPSQPDESADDLPLPPRLPSISALLNETGTQSQDSASPGGGSPGLFPPYSVFDPQAPPGYRHDVAPTAPDAAPSPSSTPALPPPPQPHYPPVASAHPDTATQAGIAFSQSRPMARPPSPPPRQLTSLEFPDGNALHPLPSGLSPSGGRRRATSASVLPLFEAAPYSRLPGFATSSERGGAGGGGGGPGDGQPDARDQQPPPPQHSHQDSPSSRLEALRPRAFSTPTREEYRAHVGWAAALPAVPARAPLHFASRPDSAVQQHHPHAHPHQQQHHAPDPTYPPMPPYPYYPGVHGPPSHVHAAQHLPPDNWSSHHLPLPYPPPPQQHHSQQQQQQQLPPPPPSLPTPPGHEQPHPHPHQQQPQQHPALPMPSGLAAQGPASPPLPSGAQQQPQPMQYSTHATGLPGQSAWLPQPPASLASSGGVEAPQDAGRYGCPHCPKRFARPSSLRIHMHSHTGEKPFTCPMCDRAFSVQSNLRRHLKIHKGGSAAPPSATSSSASASAPTPRSLPRLATDRATLGDAAADDSPADAASGSTASRPSSGSAGGLGGTGTGTDAEGDGEGEAERDGGVIPEEDEGEGEGEGERGEDEDVVMGDEQQQHRPTSASVKGDELQRGEAPPLVRTAWPDARERVN